MHLKHTLSFMMPFYHMQIYGMTYLTLMILIKLQWIITDTWHGIKDALMQLASATNLMKAINLQVKSTMKYGLVNGHWQPTFVLTGLVDLMMQILKTKFLVNLSSVLTPTCLLKVSIQFSIDQQQIWDLMDLGTKIKQECTRETAVMIRDY